MKQAFFGTNRSLSLFFDDYFAKLGETIHLDRDQKHAIFDY